MTRAMILLALVIVLTGCETVKGVGRDVTRAAETIDRVI